jgi:hypothetical protein
MPDERRIAPGQTLNVYAKITTRKRLEDVARYLGGRVIERSDAALLARSVRILGRARSWHRGSKEAG